MRDSTIKLVLVGTAVLAASTTLFFMWFFLIPRTIDVSNVCRADLNTIVYNFDDISFVSGRKIRVVGYLFKKGTATKKCASAVLLKDSKGQFYKLNTRIISRPDVVKYFNENASYFSGFEAYGVPYLIPHGPVDVYFLYSVNDETFLLDMGKRYEN